MKKKHRKELLALATDHANMHNQLMTQINQLRGDLRMNQLLINRALGRIIAKLDPIYHISERDPDRKAESDAIGEAVISKLRNEVEASNEQR